MILENELSDLKPRLEGKNGWLPAFLNLKLSQEGWKVVELIEVSQVLLAVTLGWLEKAWKGIPRALKLEAIRLQAVKEESEL